MNELWQGNFDVLKTQEDAYSVGNIIKKVFRNMAEPLFPFKTYEEFKCISGTENDEIFISKVNSIIAKLDQVNWHTIKALLKFLSDVAKFEEDNLMSANNLSVVFAPNVFKASEETWTDAIYFSMFFKMLCVMIQKNEEI